MTFFLAEILTWERNAFRIAASPVSRDANHGPDKGCDAPSLVADYDSLLFFFGT